MDIQDKIKGAYYGWFFGPGATLRKDTDANYHNIQKHPEWSKVDSFEKIPSNYTLYDQLTQTQIVQNILLDHGKITPELFKDHLLSLNEEDDILNNKQYGPSTTKTVRKLVEGKDPRETGKEGITTGAAMRCLPIGVYFRDDKEALIKNTNESCIISHNSDVSIAGALSVNLMVHALLRDKTKKQALDFVIENLRDVYGKFGEPTAFARMSERIKDSVQFIKGKDFSEATETTAKRIGFSWYAIEQIPAAFAIYFATDDAKEAALMSFKIGYGHTGPQIACAFHGTEKGHEIFPGEIMDKIERVNNIDINKMAAEITKK